VPNNPFSAEVLGGNPPATEWLYTQFPTYYTFKPQCGWQRRQKPKKSDTIGRMFTAHATSGERFYLRKLLLYTPGATSFAVVHDCIQIPQEYIFNSSEEDNNISSFVDWAYPYLAQDTVDSRSSIIAPWNAEFAPLADIAPSKNVDDAHIYT
jgi:hypothetical protein